MNALAFGVGDGDGETCASVPPQTAAGSTIACTTIQLHTGPRAPIGCKDRRCQNQDGDSQGECMLSRCRAGHRVGDPAPDLTDTTAWGLSLFGVSVATAGCPL